MKFMSKLVLVIALSASSMAFANKLKEPGALLDESEKTDRPMQLSVHGTLPWGGYYGWAAGAGAGLYIPLVKNGFISKLNDEFGIDFGVDALFHFGFTQPFDLLIPVGVRWQFHMLDNLELYAKLGVEVSLWFGAGAPGYGLYYWPVRPMFQVGAQWMFSQKVGLKLEIGYPGLRFGVLFDL